MPVYSETLPQTTTPITTTTLASLVTVLPKDLDYTLNVWVGGNIARYGITTGNLIFLIESNDEPSAVVREYFNKIVSPLGIAATASNAWKNQQYTALRLYNLGHLIIDRQTLHYTELPSAVHSIPILTLEDLKEKMPKTIPWKNIVYLTGGLVANGWSANDADFIIFDADEKTLSDMRKHFMKALGWKVHTGSKVMEDREPVYLYKIYEGGICQL